MAVRAGTHQQNRGNATQTGSSKVHEGNSAESSTRASVKIQTKAVNSGNRNYTHFVSLPLAHPTLVNKLDNFRKKITKELGIHESVFNKTKSLHLTVRMLELGGEERIKKAAEVLESVSSRVMDALENRPVLIRLKGLDLMSGSKEKALILYAPVEAIGGERRLLSACKVIIDALIDAGLVPRNDTERQLKLHVTLMNASFRRREKRSDEVVPFDARGIFELHGCEDWGEYAILEAHLSQRKLDPNGYFHCCASIPFPQNRNYTHFVSLPLAHPTLVGKVDNFRKKITKELGIHESVFNKTKSLHLTVRMLELGGEERIKKAAEVLQSVSSKVMDALENRPVLIRLKGLDLMSGSKEKALILYAPVQVIGGERRLLRACNVITDALVDAGLVPRNDTGRQLKLHVTLMNASFRRREKRSDEVVPFDARGIFELYGREEWGEYAIREAHLSQRKFDPNGYFHCCASIPFPQV